MNKLIHGLILAPFAFGCYCLWGVLNLTSHFLPDGAVLPMFSQFCVNLRPALLAVPGLATLYCLYVWLRRSENQPRWIGFFAVAMMLLVLLTILVFIAAWLPLVKVIELKG